MIYPYKCPKCGHAFEVIKSVRELDNQELCQKCDTPAIRYIARTHFYGAGDWNKQYYNPAFGKVIRSNAHLREELRIAAGEGREMVEIGNEPLEKLNAQAEKRQVEIRENRWKAASKELGIE